MAKALKPSMTVAEAGRKGGRKTQSKLTRQERVAKMRWAAACSVAARKGEPKPNRSVPSVEERKALARAAKAGNQPVPLTVVFK